MPPASSDNENIPANVPSEGFLIVCLDLKLISPQHKARESTDMRCRCVRGVAC